MPKEVSPQVDIGSLTLNGLASFTPILAALTADNVHPMAMVQLENLGSLFHTSGKFAAKVPDLLQRCSSTRLDHLGMSLGWRKGDAASIMSQSAGGQAMALLCFYLRNLYTSADCGEVLMHLSANVLQKNLAISSVAQLADVANLLSGKMQALGFGNFLAEQTMWIHKIFEHLEKPVAPDFLNIISKESMVDLLTSLSKAFSEERTIVRISGSGGMGYIIALATILFPSDTTLTIEGLIVQEGTRGLICLECNDTTGSGVPVQVEVEKIIHQGHSNCFPVAIMAKSPLELESRCFFAWEGHVADSLTVLFANFGLTCTSALLVACCDLLISLPATIAVAFVEQHQDIDGEPGSLLLLLGPEPMQRLYYSCRAVLRETPSSKPKSTAEAYQDLVRAFKETLGTQCQCMCEGVDHSSDFGANHYGARNKCGLFTLWSNVLEAVSHALWSIFVHADANAVVEPNAASACTGSLAIRDSIDCSMKGRQQRYVLNAYTVHDHILSIVKGYSENPREIASSNGASALIPVSLLRVERGLCEGLYELRDGQIVVNGRYYRRLLTTVEQLRAKSSNSLFNPGGRISPSSLGEHSDLVFTVREELDVAKLRGIAKCQGQSLRLDIFDIIVSSMLAQCADPCTHDPDSILDEAHSREVITTSIAAPSAKDDNIIAIVQTKGNPVAQLLACEDEHGAILQSGCCLNCAFEQAKKWKFCQIIVG